MRKPIGRDAHNIQRRDRAIVRKVKRHIVSVFSKSERYIDTLIFDDRRNMWQSQRNEHVYVNKPLDILDVYSAPSAKTVKPSNKVRKTTRKPVAPDIQPRDSRVHVSDMRGILPTHNLT